MIRHILPAHRATASRKLTALHPLLIAGSLAWMLGATTASAQVFDPVSQTVTATATAAGPTATATDAPPDATAGASFTTVTNSALADTRVNGSEGTSAQISASSEIRADRLEQSFSSTSSGTDAFNNRSSASGSATAVFGVAASGNYRLRSVGESFYGDGTLTLDGPAGEVATFDLSSLSTTPFPGPFDDTRVLSLAPGQYTLAVDYHTFTPTGVGGPGSATITLSTVPEPATAGLLLAAVVTAAVSRPIRTRRKR